MATKPVSRTGDHASRRCKKGGEPKKPQGGIPKHDILVLARGTPARRIIHGVLAPKEGNKPTPITLMEERDGARSAARKVFPISLHDAARMISHADSLSSGVDDFGFFEVKDDRAGLIKQIPSMEVAELVRA